MKLFNFQMKLGICCLLVIAMGALFAPWISSYDPWAIDISLALQAPSWNHLFGLDENGIDVLVQVIYGARISLIVAFSVVCINLMVGIVIGSISGWLGSVWDQILMRLVDLVSAFPRFLLALTILAMLGSSLFHLILAMCLSGWASFARLVRGEILHLKNKEYVLGAQSYGAGNLRILICHIWPNLLGLILVQATFSLVAVVIGEAGLTFLGLGLPPEIPSWGRLMSSGRQVLMTAPHVILFPGLALFILILGFQLCAQSLRDYFDPYPKDFCY